MVCAGFGVREAVYLSCEFHEWTMDTYVRPYVDTFVPDALIV